MNSTTHHTKGNSMSPTEHTPKTPRSTTGLFALLGALLCIAGSGASAALPATASADATIEPPPVFSNAAGLPDGRVYEQVVSNAELNGNEAGATSTSEDTGDRNRYGLSSPDGMSVLFEGSGPIGESPWGASTLFVATRNDDPPGWRSRAVTPAGRKPIGEAGGILKTKLEQVMPSRDLSHALVQSGTNVTLAPQPNEGCGARLYLTGADPFVSATLLEQPELVAPATSVENCSGAYASGAAVGGTPDFSTVYFTYPGTLLPEDASRAPHSGTSYGVEAWGFYEEREGALREAGVLPDGGLDPFGAVPAASAHGRAIFGNQVAAEGREAFFVSPDPASCGGQNDCETDPPELYVRENGERTLLVSRDPLRPEAAGLPASAPTGVVQMPNAAYQPNGGNDNGSYVFASSDGSQAFFQSEDRLTSDAPEGPPGDTEVKTYDFDVDTGVLTYLPGVTGELIATGSDGSALAFVRPEAEGAPAELELWSGPGAGTVRPVVQLPGPAVSGGGGPNGGTPTEYISEAQFSSDGSVLVFTTGTPIVGFHDGGSEPQYNNNKPIEEVYRYVVSGDALGCVSCVPVGVAPRGSSSMSTLRPEETYEVGEPVSAGVDQAGVSADGDIVFFDSPDPLVARDVNTGSPPVPFVEEELRAQGRDVYEWNDGVVSLVSTGTSRRNSYFLGSSEDGSDVFFATTEAGLTPGDTGGGYDVYDARVPGPGEQATAAPGGCESAACEGPASVPSPLTPPTSATFSGPGNPTPEVTPPPPAKTTTKTVKCKKGFTKKKNKCVTNKKKAKRASHNGRAK